MNSFIQIRVGGDLEHWHLFTRGSDQNGIGGPPGRTVWFQRESQTVALTRLDGFEFGCKPTRGMLNFFDSQRLRFVIHNFDDGLVPLTLLSSYEKSWPWREFDWRCDNA